MAETVTERARTPTESYTSFADILRRERVDSLAAERAAKHVEKAAQGAKRQAEQEAAREAALVRRFTVAVEQLYDRVEAGIYTLINEIIRSLGEVQQDAVLAYLSSIQKEEFLEEIKNSLDKSKTGEESPLDKVDTDEQSPFDDLMGEKILKEALDEECPFDDLIGEKILKKALAADTETEILFKKRAALTAVKDKLAANEPQAAVESCSESMELLQKGAAKSGLDYLCQLLKEIAHSLQSVFSRRQKVVIAGPVCSGVSLFVTREQAMSKLGKTSNSLTAIAAR